MTCELLYTTEILDSDGCIECCAIHSTVSECVRWFKDNGISMDEIATKDRPNYCIFSYQRSSAE